jgi:multisubunit Na+/H+ antiporter MnhF subunit
VTAWLVGCGVLLALLAPLLGVAALGSAEDGLVALQVAGTVTALALLLFAAGSGRAAVSDLALVAGAASLVGTLAFAALLEREP